MDHPSGNASSSDAHFNGGDWSPRISFSHGFACAQRVPSPANKSALHDSEFEFSRSIGTDLLSADELFCNGKLRPLKLSSHEGGKTEPKASQKKDEPHAAERGKRKGALVVSGNSSKEDCSSVCKEDSICQWEQKTRRNAGEAKSPTSRAEPISACRRAEKAAIGKKPVNPASPPTRKVDLPCINRMAEKPDDGKPATSRLYTSSKGLPCACNPEMGGKAGESESPTSRKEVISAHKIEMGNNAGKVRSPTCRGELISACKLETSRKTVKEVSRSSREDVMLACKRAENPELKGKAGEIEMKTSREDLLSACGNSWTCEKGGVPVRWREERQWPKQEEHASLHSRRFSKNPRSASMVMEGSWMLDNHRSCVSLNNSRCPSPSRSFSLPATTPASPSASSSISGFSASSFSSSSSRYRSKIREFFKLKKLALPKEETLPPVTSSSSSTCRLPLSPRSLIALFKSKESTKAGSIRSSNSMHNVPQEAQEHVCASTKGVYSGAHKENFAKGKDLNALSQSQINSSIKQELAIPCLTLPNSAKSHPNPSFPCHFPPSSASKAIASIETTSKCSAGSKPRAHTHKSHSFSQRKVLGVNGPTMLVIDEGLWEEGNLKRSNNALHLNTHCPTSKEGSPRLKKGNNVTMGGNSKGGHVRPKGLERPMPYTSSVRVTPVLNVPSCITPSLRKAKSSSKPKAFSFESLFAKRERALI